MDFTNSFIVCILQQCIMCCRLMEKMNDLIEISYTDFEDAILNILV